MSPRTHNYYGININNYFSKVHKVWSPDVYFLVSVVKKNSGNTSLTWEVAFEEAKSWDVMTGAWYQCPNGGVNYAYRNDILLGHLISQQPFTGARWFRIVPNNNTCTFDMSVIEFYSASRLNRIG